MSKKGESVKVVIRCRPLSEKEIADNRQKIVEVDEKKGELTILNPKQTDESKQFTFDQVFNC